MTITSDSLLKVEGRNREYFERKCNMPGPTYKSIHDCKITEFGRTLWTLCARKLML
jgi:hypothetical protein